MKKPPLLQCGSCRRPSCASELLVRSVKVIVCSECSTSTFKLDRLVAEITGQPIVCECEGCKSRAARGRL